jgi:hypothetical protein
MPGPTPTTTQVFSAIVTAIYLLLLISIALNCFTNIFYSKGPKINTLRHHPDQSEANYPRRDA